jgi:hypothetical protein
LEHQIMRRTTVTLTSGQLRGLKEVSQLSHLSQSSLIRVFVTEGISRERRKQAAQVVLPGTRVRRQAVLGE